MKKALLIFALLALLSSCTNELAFEGSTAPDALVLAAQFRDTEEEHYVYAAVSSGGSLAEVPDDLKVFCYVNGSPSGECKKVEKDAGEGVVLVQSAYHVDARFSPGDEVRIEAEGGGFSASGVTTIPKAPTLSAVDTATVESPSFWQASEVVRDFVVTLTLDDPPEDNWYMVEAALIQEATLKKEGKEDGFFKVEYTFTINPCDDPILSEGVILSNDEVLGTYTINTFSTFKDTLFQGEKGTLSFSLDYDKMYLYHVVDDMPLSLILDYDKAIIESTLEIRLWGVSMEEYNYLRAIGVQAMAMYNPNFIEPMTIPVNVEGGTGFIGALTAETRAFKLPEGEYDLSLL